MPGLIDMPQPPRRHRLLFLVLAIVAVALFSSRTALSYYVTALWFGALGYEDVFRKTLSLEWTVFAAFFVATFLFLYGWFLTLRRAYQPEFPDDHMIIIGGQALRLPVERILRLIGLVVALLIALGTATSFMTEWSTFALYWYAPPSSGSVLDPIFGKPINFYLFTLPAWQSVTSWLLTLAVLACVIAVFFILSTRALAGRRAQLLPFALARISVAFAFFLLILAMRVYIGRFERLFDDHTIFGGVTYTDAHVMLTGTLVVCAALVLGAVIAAVNSVSRPRAALAGGSRRPGRPLLSRPSGIRLVCKQLYREAKRTGSRTTLH